MPASRCIPNKWCTPKAANTRSPSPLPTLSDQPALLHVLLPSIGPRARERQTGAGPEAAGARCGPAREEEEGLGHNDGGKNSARCGAGARRGAAACRAILRAAGQHGRAPCPPAPALSDGSRGRVRRLKRVRWLQVREARGSPPRPRPSCGTAARRSLAAPCTRWHPAPATALRMADYQYPNLDFDFESAAGMLLSTRGPGNGGGLSARSRASGTDTTDLPSLRASRPPPRGLGVVRRDRDSRLLSLLHAHRARRWETGQDQARQDCDGPR